MYYGGFTYSEAYNLSVAERRWFLTRISDEISKSRQTEDGS